MSIVLTADATCGVDNTIAIRQLISQTENAKVILPAGTFCLNSANPTIVINKPIEISGAGKKTIIKWNAPTRTPIAPIFDITGNGVVIHDLSFDHNAESGKYSDSAYFGKDPWGDVAVSIQGNNFVGYNLFVANGFDNCIGISRRNESGGAVRGEPKNFSLHNINTWNCGVGIHSAQQGGPGKIGSGIDVGSGSAGTIRDVVDNGSYIGFIVDIGAGANAQWTNVTANNTKVDPEHPKNGSGYGLYVGDAGSTFANVKINSPQLTGVWNDAYAAHTRYTNLSVLNAARACLFLKGSINAEGVTCAQYRMPRSSEYADVKLDSSAPKLDAKDAMQGIDISSLSIIGQRKARVLEVAPTSRHPISGNIRFGKLPPESAAELALPGPADALAVVQQGR